MKTNHFKTKKVIAILLCIVLAAGVFEALPHCWLPVSTANIHYNGKKSSGSRLYRGGNGELVVMLSEPKESSPYLLAPI